MSPAFPTADDLMEPLWIDPLYRNDPLDGPTALGRDRVIAEAAAELRSASVELLDRLGAFSEADGMDLVSRYSPK